MIKVYSFNLFTECAINEIGDHYRAISISRHQIHSIRLAAILVDTEEQLSLLLHTLDSSLAKFKLKMNREKTKAILIHAIITTLANMLSGNK